MDTEMFFTPFYFPRASESKYILSHTRQSRRSEISEVPVKYASSSGIFRFMDATDTRYDMA